MQAKHEKTREAIFSKPTAHTVPYRDVRALLLALGCTEQQGNGSRIRFVHGTSVLTMHEPHPGKEIKEYQVKMVRDFLHAIGEGP